MSDEDCLQLLQAVFVSQAKARGLNRDGCECSVDKALLFLDCFVERGLRTCGPLYVFCAVCLMLTVTYTFFFVLLVEVSASWQFKIALNDICLYFPDHTGEWEFDDDLSQGLWSSASL